MNESFILDSIFLYARFLIIIIKKSCTSFD